MIDQYPVVWRGGWLLLLGSVLSGCGSSTPPVAEIPPPPVTVSQPLVRELVDEDQYEGRIKAFDKADIRARVRGHLIKVNFKPGQMVEKDELLYLIDPRQYKAAFNAAKAQQRAAKAGLEYAVADFNRTQSLYDRKAASRQELELAAAKKSISEGEVAKAAAAVEEAKNNVDFTKIIAPFSGRISRTQVDLGNLVNVGGGETLLTTLITVDPFYVSFDVDERALRSYQKNFRKKYKGKGSQPPLKDLHIPVYVALEGDKGYPHKGELVFADNQVNPKTGTKEVRGLLSNAENIYDEGMRARVSVPVSDPYKALLVTERAVGIEQGKKFVYVVNKDNLAERRDITAGRLVNGLLVIRDGLKRSDWVIVNGIQRVRDGMPVEPKRGPMPGAAEFDQAAKKNRKK